MRKEWCMKHAMSLPSGRRTVLAVLLALVVGLALVVVASLATQQPANAAPRIVSKTFSNTGQIFIPDGAVPGDRTTCATGDTVGSANPYPSEKSVGGFPSGSHITDVNLTLKNYRHSFPDDVDVLLAHAGKNRTVMSDRGNGLPGVSNITITLDDEAAQAVPDETNPTGGRFRPANSDGNDGFPSPAPNQNFRSALSAFDTLNPNGTWRLFVQDDSGQDCGKFGGGWSITIKAAVPQ
jgi:hypothetical protein